MTRCKLLAICLVMLGAVAYSWAATTVVCDRIDVVHGTDHGVPWTDYWYYYSLHGPTTEPTPVPPWWKLTAFPDWEPSIGTPGDWHGVVGPVDQPNDRSDITWTYTGTSATWAGEKGYFPSFKVISDVAPGGTIDWTTSWGDTGKVTNAVATPEPASFVLMGSSLIGGLGVARMRRRRRTRRAATPS
jgi:hypothetical protein